ncbi:MAG: peptidoglycan bridge formation glycyltransferase FemA/FemB family protein [Patescibacteria group bacterium]|nr:peptidoglycan bridge formation glycyltransferase FemA/FemB family protein [Patescibacteria group bacterium]
MDLRQSPQWGNFLSQIGWQVIKIGKSQAYLKKLPLINCSMIKIQRPFNPLPWTEIDQLAKKNHALMVVIEPQTNNYNEQELVAHGYKKTLNMSLSHTATIEIALTKPIDKIYQDFSENARRNIKKAQTHDLQIKTVFLKNTPDDQTFQQFYKLLKNVTKVRKFYVPGYDEFFKKMLAFKDSSALIFAFQKGQVLPIAALWQGFFNKTAVYMHIGISDQGYKLLANYLLVWEALKLAKEQGMEVFDFEGIYDPRFPTLRQRWQGFTQFKKKFHGQLVQYPIAWIKFYNFWFKLFYLCNTIFTKY